MYREHTVGVVIPAHDEAGFIGSVLERLPSFVDRAYVVDDGSTDATWDVLMRSADRLNETESAHADRTTGTDGGAALEPRIQPIRHDRNRGVGAAIKTGYMAALDDELDIVTVMAGDDQMDPLVLERLLDPVVEDRADYAKGTRLLSREFHQGMSTWRFVGNTILSVLTKIASGYWKTTDPQNGYTAISGDALEAVDIEGLYEDYGYCNHLLVKLNVQEMRVADVAIPAIYGTEQSGIMYPKYIRKVSLMLLSSFLWRLQARYLVRDFHPLALLYYAGAATAGSGILSGLRTLYTATDRDEQAHLKAASSLLLFALGWLFMLLAMVFDMKHNEDKELRIETTRSDSESVGIDDQPPKFDTR
ncbi:glycosyltransferase family 2 protein [Salinadaptatus halalkaliphilus]|uniref:Glycosyltransferase family 2 protein n=1 Tax=Salinadaptatus halalkaliphilus TaxID=2419781 RepID=A0A4S3TMV3_9EURY|nr:glycosyltransferase family 2 protein [Salinadaptatus halalkaliphilus]THE64543.1 glycosyltransferase family 2 protein [Salinadaptatus halalkaliphilus]